MKKNAIITEKDLLILQKLLEDGRKSSSSISKEIDLGREIVNYRIKRLIKENLIVKFVPKINDKALNYQEYIILIKLNLEDELSKEQFVREHMGNKYLLWFIKSNEGWDLIVRLYAQSVDEFKLKLSEILDSFSDVLANYYTIISSEEIAEQEKSILNRELFHMKDIKKDFKLVTNNSQTNLDDKDNSILRLLEEDGRIQYKDIATRLDISSDTVKYRIDKMIEQGVIEKFMPVLNLNKVGLHQFAAIIKCKYLNKENEEEIISEIKKSSYVVKAIKSLDSKEYFVTLAFEKEENSNSFKEDFEKKYSDKIESIELFKID